MPPPKSLPGLPDNYTSQFFQADVVTKRSDPSYRAKVLRCWADEEGVLPPLPPGEEMHPLDRPLLRGEVGISEIRTNELSIVPESTLDLVNRDFIKGDIVKHSLVDVESAIVLDTQVDCILTHAMSGKRLREWVPFQKLKNSFLIESRDRVVYDEWLGIVEEVFEDGLVETYNGETYRIANMTALLEPGRIAADALHESPPGVNLPSHFPASANPEMDRIIQVRPIVVCVMWNAINQQIPVSEHDKHPEPKRFWSGEEIEKLTLFDGMHRQAPPLGTTLMFRDSADEKAYGAEPTMHARGTVSVNVYKVTESRLKLKLRWQDGTETEEWAAGFVPYQNIDDYETWPGEHLVYAAEGGERRAAVIQTFDPHQRIAEVLFPATKEKETVSVLDLDTGAFGRVAYGVAIGQIVLFCNDNNTALPEVPSLGQVDTQFDRQSLDLVRAYAGYAAAPERYGSFLPRGDPSAVQWWGEVTDLHLDGTVTVSLNDDTAKRVNIQNLIILNEPTAEAFMDEPMDGDDEYMDGEDDYAHSDDGWETLSDGEGNEIEIDEGDESDEMEEEMVDSEYWGAEERNQQVVDIIVDEEENETADPIAMIEPNGGDQSMEDEDDERDAEAVDIATDNDVVQVSQPRQVSVPSTEASSTSVQVNPVQAEAGPSTVSTKAGSSKTMEEDDEQWQRFMVLEEAPMEHHFYAEPAVSGAGKAYMSRVAKEQRALAGSLPENILVRTYEDRLDLMRVLIIGPEGTPYNDAPFVFDIYLNPTKFPFEPPQVFFHSHTNGLGRCNPNLYEDGKVCLSILGTWSGDKSESWNPTKSSLLQVFVSISGLVLVRSPYHCEPAFAKLEGTREGRVNSRLYSEKAYVLSRSFIRTALERPPAGFADEIKYFYFTRSRLNSVIAHARALMDKGESAAGGSNGAAATGSSQDDEENAEMWNADAMGSLTMGAILTLKRTIGALDKIAEKAQQ